MYGSSLYNGGVKVTTSATVDNSAAIWMIVALVLSLAGAIAIYFAFVKNKNIKSKSKFVNWLKDFLDFKTMWIEAILKMMYYFMTLFVILASFATITSNFFSFLFTLILGPVIVRLAYEASMVLIGIWKNTREIANNTAESEIKKIFKKN